MTFAASIDQALKIHRAGRPAEAIPLYRALLAERPEDPDLRHLLALALVDIEPMAGQAELRRALTLAPATGLYLHNAAHLADASNQEALARLLTHALAADPMRVAAQHRLGALDARAGRPAAAARRFRRALALEPSFPAALFDLANLAADTHQIQAARTGYMRLLAAEPTHQSGLTNLGALLYRRHLWPDAEKIFIRLTRLAPHHTDAWAALGACRAETGDIAPALACVRAALALDPGSGNTWHTLATLFLKDLATSEPASVAATRATCLVPAMTSAHTTRALAFFHQGRVRKTIAARRAIIALTPDDALAYYDFLPFLHLDPDLRPDEQIAFRRRVHRRFSDPLTRRAPSHRNDPDPDRRLKIAYVDNQMLYRSTHSTNLLPTIEAHDPTEVELHFYTNLSRDAADDMTERYAAAAAGFHYTEGLSDAQVAQLVRDHRIDILIDVSGHLTGARTGVFVAKPAPIQVTMLQVGSSGLAAMDYAVADAVLLPTGRPTFYSEEILRLPVGFLFEPVADLTPPISSSPGGLPPTFGSFNLLVKLNERCLSLWARVLAAVPGSRLLLKAAGLASPETCRRLREFFSERGIAAGRLEFCAWTRGYAEHLAMFNEVDVVLDCFPYPGMTTSLEALLMGTPVVTLAGDRFAGRIGEAILHGIGHPEWIAPTEDAYVDIAASLMADADGRRVLRRRLREDLLASPFTDAAGFTRSLERAFRSAWRLWCARHRPAHAH